MPESKYSICERPEQDDIKAQFKDYKLEIVNYNGMHITLVWQP